MKHSFEAHYNNVQDVWRETHPHGYSFDKGYETITWFTAYERWLNDRDLMPTKAMKYEQRTPDPEIIIG